MIALYLAAELLLVGTITGPRPVATFRSGREVLSVEPGAVLDGERLLRVGAGFVVLASPEAERVVRAGDFVVDGRLSRGIDVKGAEVTMTPEVHRWIAEEGTAAIVMEATATEVPGVGWRLWNFEPWTVFALSGLVPGDVVRAVDGEALGTPEQALAVLRRTKAKRAFTVDLVRDGRPMTLTVRVKP